MAEVLHFKLIYYSLSARKLRNVLLELEFTEESPSNSESQ